jgi:hypothetical protein
MSKEELTKQIMYNIITTTIIPVFLLSQKARGEAQ